MKNKNGQKQSEGKLFIKFMLLMVIAFIVGGTVGFAGHYISDVMLGQGEVFERFASAFSKVVPIVFVVLNIVVNTVCLIIFVKAKKQADVWDGEDEDTIDDVERKLNFVLVPSNILTGLNYFFFGAMFQAAEYAGDGNIFGVDIMIVGIVVFLLGLFFSMLIAKLVVDLEKKLNPEKKGSVFEMQFQKTWLESCDEAQKQVIYRAAFETYKVVNTVCMIMWLITLVAQMLFETGLFPVFSVCVIWVTLIATYSIVSAKLENK